MDTLTYRYFDDPTKWSEVLNERGEWVPTVIPSFMAASSPLILVGYMTDTRFTIIRQLHPDGSASEYELKWRVNDLGREVCEIREKSLDSK